MLPRLRSVFGFNILCFAVMMVDGESSPSPSHLSTDSGKMSKICVLVLVELTRGGSGAESRNKFLALLY